MYISYKDIFKNAWQITVQNRALWIFGIFASFISLENVYEIILTQFNELKNAGSFFNQVLNLYHTQLQVIDSNLLILSLFSQNLSAYFSFMIFGALMILIVWLAFTSQILVIKSTALLYHGKKINLFSIFQASDAKFWPVFIINLIVKLILYAGYLALSLPLLYMLLINSVNGIFLANLSFFLLFTIFAVCLSFISAYATNFIVLRDYHILEAFSAAWKLFQKNVVISLELAFTLFFLKLISLILIVCLAVFFAIPISLVFLITWSSKDLIGIVMSLTLMLLALSFISLFINAIFNVFYLSSWTITFIKLTEETLLGRIFAYIRDFPQSLNALAKRWNIKIDKKEAKKVAGKLAKQTEAEVKVLAKNIAEKYKQYKPIAQKQSKIMVKEIQAAYIKYEPRFEKEAKKIVLQLKKKLKNPKPAEKIDRKKSGKITKKTKK